ncbi:MAG: glycosyltransferase family 4 protein [Chitinophagaceae bacterium]|nr:glycosyltransferase family 4 protein [Chitinophagaceae bacterium]
MKILYIHQYFNTPQEPGGTRSYWFSKELVNAGHEVIMFTSARKEQQHFIERKNIEGIAVTYVRNTYNGEMGVIQRAWSFVRFMFYAIWFGIRQKDIDLVYATSTPLSVAFPAMVIKWFKGVPFIFEVRDLWPEVPIQMGAIKNKLLIKLLYWFEKRIYISAAHVVTLSPGMKEGVLKYGIPEQKVSMIPNMSKKEEFYERPKNEAIAKAFGISLNKFNAIHFGAMGIANHLEYIIDAAADLKKRNLEDIDILFLGSGSVESKLKQRCESEGLSNVKFLGKHPMQTLSEIVNLCDVSIVSFANIPVLYTNSPNKLFDSLSAAKPIIVNSAGWTKEMVEHNHCGLFTNPDSPKSLADALFKLSTSPETVKKMGTNSRSLAETVYDKTIACKTFYALINRFNKA